MLLPGDRGTGLAFTYASPAFPGTCPSEKGRAGWQIPVRKELHERANRPLLFVY